MFLIKEKKIPIFKIRLQYNKHEKQYYSNAIVLSCFYFNGAKV